MNSAARLLHNTVWNTIGRALQVLIALFMTPYLLTKLGEELFGLWAFSRLLLGYLSLADLGIQASLVRQIAFGLSEGGVEKVNRIVSTSFFFFVGLSIVVGPLTVLLGPPAVRLAASLQPMLFTPEHFEEATFVLTFTAGTFFASTAISVICSVLQGLQRMDLSNQISLGSQALTLIATVAVLEGGWGIRGLVIVTLLVRVLEAIAVARVSTRTQEGFQVRARDFSWGMWKELFDYAWKIQVTRFAEFTAFTFDRMFISFVAGAAALGRFHPAVQIVNQARMLPFLVVSATLPYVSELSARKERDTLRRFYIEGTKYLSVAGFALIGFVAATAPVLVRFWLGPGYDEVATWVRLLAIGYVISTPLGVGGLLSQAIGRPGIQARSSLILAGLEVTAAPLGYYFGGLNGLAAGSAAAVGISNLWFFWKFNAVLGVPKRRVIRESLLEPALWLLPTAWAIGGLASWRMPVDAGRGEASLILAAASIAYGLVCLTAIWKMDLHNVHDRLKAAHGHD